MCHCLYSLCFKSIKKKSGKKIKTITAITALQKNKGDQSLYLKNRPTDLSPYHPLFPAVFFHFCAGWKGKSVMIRTISGRREGPEPVESQLSPAGFRQVWDRPRAWSEIAEAGASQTAIRRRPRQQKEPYQPLAPCPRMPNLDGRSEWDFTESAHAVNPQRASSAYRFKREKYIEIKLYL